MRQSRVEELNLTALSMTDYVRERESEVTEAVRDLRRQQADNNRCADACISMYMCLHAEVSFADPVHAFSVE